MTAPIRIDHFARTEQSLIKLNSRACQMGEQVHSLEEQVISQLKQLLLELDKEIAQSKKFIPLYDREKFYQWNEKFLEKFYNTLFKLFLETRQYEILVHEYHAINQTIKEEVAHG
jgi:hypothetical protein